MVPTTNEIRVTRNVYKITCNGENSVPDTMKQIMDTIMAGNVKTATCMSPR